VSDGRWRAACPAAHGDAGRGSWVGRVGDAGRGGADRAGAAGGGADSDPQDTGVCVCVCLCVCVCVCVCVCACVVEGIRSSPWLELCLGFERLESITSMPGLWAGSERNPWYAREAVVKAAEICWLEHISSQARPFLETYLGAFRVLRLLSTASILYSLYSLQPLLSTASTLYSLYSLQPLLSTASTLYSLYSLQPLLSTASIQACGAASTLYTRDACGASGSRLHARWL
jgi:hypothetical protein